MRKQLINLTLTLGLFYIQDRADILLFCQIFRRLEHSTS